MRIARCGFEALRRAALSFFVSHAWVLGIEQALGTLGKVHKRSQRPYTRETKRRGQPTHALEMSVCIRAIIWSWASAITQALGNIGKRHGRGRSDHTHAGRHFGGKRCTPSIRVHLGMHAPWHGTRPRPPPWRCTVRVYSCPYMTTTTTISKDA